MNILEEETLQDPHNDIVSRKIPFTFSEEVTAFDKCFARLLGKSLESEQLQFLSADNMQGYSHGVNWQSYYASDPNEIRVMQKHEHEITIKFKDIMNNEIGVIHETLQSLVKQMTASFMKTLYSTINDSTEKTGNVVSTAGSGSYPAAFLQMLEKIEFGVDRNGNPTLPQIHAPPEVAEKMLAELSSQGPEFAEKVDEIKKKKIFAAIEREQARRSKFARIS